jgi:hypothetical protein
MASEQTAMSTWSEVLRFVRERYLLQQDEAGHFVMSFQLPPPPGSEGKPAGKVALPLLDEASQAAAIQTLHGQPLSSGEGKPSWLLLRAEVCGERALSPTAALRHSARLLLGALVLSGNHYVLRHTLPLSGLDLPTLEFTLDYVVREAAALRQRVLAQTGSPPRSALGQPLND